MHITPFLVDYLLNGSVRANALIDTRCLCFSVFDANFVRNNNFAAKQIKPKILNLASGEATQSITEVTYVSLDINGQSNIICGYVVPALAYPLIQGKPWMEQNNITYIANKHCLDVERGQNRVVIKDNTHTQQSTSPSISLLGAGGISNRCEQSTEILAIVTYDKAVLSLPEKVHQFTNIIVDDDAISSQGLPPNRIGVDTKIKLLKDESGKEKDVPWGPLCSMSRNELLVLRHTLTGLLSKKWIRPRSSSGGAPVLFVKKPGGGLRFCVDYRGLNAMKKRGRYPMPLINKALRWFSKATWISKVDVRTAFQRLRIAQSDEWKTVFRTRFGSYEWLITLCGLAGVPAASHR